MHIHPTAKAREGSMLTFVPDAADESVAAGKMVQQHLDIKEMDRIGARKNFVLFLV